MASEVCSHVKGLRIPYHNKADGFMAALVLMLNQVKLCERNGCQPHVTWGAFPACKYAGVRFPGRNPFFDATHGPNAFEYFFQPICGTSQHPRAAAPTLTCEQREVVHRVLPWVIRTYNYGTGSSSGVWPGRELSNETFDEAWYAAQRAEGARLVASYLRLQPRLAERIAQLEAELLENHRPILGVHLRGTDKGKYLQSAGSGKAIGPAEYEPYVRGFLATHGDNASVFVATDSPSYLNEALQNWPTARLIYRHDVLRHEQNAAFVRTGTGSAAKAIRDVNYRKGEDVLFDTLLLSRCDFLLHAASGVAEAAMYWNPRLHHHSVHLQYSRGRQQPAWMRRWHTSWARGASAGGVG
eukprot:CAMPEP_0115877934 /NCGR_PEP_ID=MMETSP0287-20121206/26494_1 /TAXON_ID=412157 /ORGANISM="Chrysochromulina rotalis, Strain UIO044" /LENGTH=354 /DNA_ID=CAMNT_0003333495 /DNA_START=126 /DNA_END=1190 /DNA_ORIENTATION=+